MHEYPFTFFIIQSFVLTNGLALFLPLQVPYYSRINQMTVFVEQSHTWKANLFIYQSNFVHILQQLTIGPCFDPNESSPQFENLSFYEGFQPSLRIHIVQCNRCEANMLLFTLHVYPPVCLSMCYNSELLNRFLCSLILWISVTPISIKTGHH
jgi:hypothetical protein